MKIVRFLGGLGNQMFQYAFYRSLKSRFRNVKGDLSAFEGYGLHNGFELEEVFDITLDRASPFWIKIYDPVHRGWMIRKMRRLLNLKRVYQEEEELFYFDGKLLEDPESRLYWGYWQNAGYFENIETLLREDFTFKKPLSQKNQGVLGQINSSNSVGIHVRRGDYLSNKLLGGICDLNYYQKAIVMLKEKISDPAFFIFSNDIEWCKASLDLPKAQFVSWNYGQQSYVDMQLMSQCKHNVIANSSFSWWSAWLNDHKDKMIIAPARWTNDQVQTTSEITPKEWLTL